MNIRMKLVVIGLGVAVVAAVALGAAIRSIPSDESLRSRFFSHRTDFERLATMANEDSHLTRISPDFTWLDDNVSWPRSNIGISEARWNDYRQLFEAVGTSKGILKGTNPARIIFPITSEGSAPTGYAKGLVYSQARLSPVLKSLDKKLPRELWDGPDRSHVLVYTPIEDHWYIYYEQW